MKRSKKPRVSWPPGPKLCQVKMFRTEDCPAKVASQPQRHNYTKQPTGKPRGPDLPPGFEGNHYVDKLNVSNIPWIKWKRPSKILVNDSWLIGDGGESTERRSENLRIDKVLEAIYPHRSAIPSRSSVSPVVEAESFDDSKTPTIRLTPIEDEWESSHTAFDSSFNANKLDQLEIRLPCSTEEHVSGLAPDLSLAASAALTALMKTKEHGSMVDPDLLIKFLSDPKMIKNLITDATGKTSETKNQSVVTNTNPTELVQRHVTTSAIARKPQPITIPQKRSCEFSQPFTNSDQRRVSPPTLRVGNVTPLKTVNENPLDIPMHVHSSLDIAKGPSHPTQLQSSPLLVNFLNLHRPQHNFSEPKVRVNPKLQLQPNSSLCTSEMNNVQASIGFGKHPQTGFDTYPMNLNRVDATCKPKPVVQPVKSLDYFKNLIREHGMVNRETTQYNSQTGKINGLVVHNIKVKKQCIYYGTARGCKLGDRCIYVHDRLRPKIDGEAPMAKRVKFGRCEKSGI